MYYNRYYPNYYRYRYNNRTGFIVPFALGFLTAPFFIKPRPYCYGPYCQYQYPYYY